jgi:hypothetical protein
MNAQQSLRLLRRQGLVPRLQARQMRSLLRTATQPVVLLPPSLWPTAQLLWLVTAPPPTPAIH